LILPILRLLKITVKDQTIINESSITKNLTSRNPLFDASMSYMENENIVFDANTIANTLLANSDDEDDGRTQKRTLFTADKVTNLQPSKLTDIKYGENIEDDSEVFESTMEFKAKLQLAKSEKKKDAERKVEQDASTTATGTVDDTFDNNKEEENKYDPDVEYPIDEDAFDQLSDVEREDLTYTGSVTANQVVGLLNSKQSSDMELSISGYSNLGANRTGSKCNTQRDHTDLDQIDEGNSVSNSESLMNDTGRTNLMGDEEDEVALRDLDLSDEDQPHEDKKEVTVGFKESVEVGAAPNDDLYSSDDEFVEGNNNNGNDEFDCRRTIQKLFEDVFNEPCIKEGVIPDPPARDYLFEYCLDIILAAKMEKECSIICLVYIERLMNKTGFPLDHMNWRRVTISSLMLASKVWDDDSFENVNFAQVFQEFSLDEINNLERTFLSLIDYDVVVKGSEYARYYFILRTYSEKHRAAFPLKPLDRDMVKNLQTKAEAADKRLREMQAKAFYRTL